MITKIMLTSLAPALAMSMFAGAVDAQVELDPNIDVDGDGVYSFTEMSTVYTEMTAEDFTLIDADGDGLLNMEEVGAAVEAQLLPVTDG